MSVLVTGAGGFIGAYAVDAVARAGRPVLAASHDPARPAALLARLQPGARRVPLPDSAAAIAALIDAEGVDLVLHLAGRSQVGAALADPPATLAANAGVTATLLEGVRRSAAPPATVVASTDGVYGGGDGTPFTEDAPVACATPYEASKAAAELMARAYAATFELPVAIVRFGNVYGPGDTNFDRIVPRSVRRIIAGEPPVLRDGGDSERSYLYVTDAVAGLLAVAAIATDPAARGAAWNVCGDRAVTTLEMMTAILAATGRTDLGLAIEARPPGQEISRKRASAARLAARTGWRPRVPLAEGLARVVAFARAETP